MFKENWKTVAFWRWWWRSQVPTDAKYMAAVMLAGVLIVGGYFASGHLAGASAAQSDSYVRETTISKIVTVTKNGRRIVKRVPVVVRKTVVHSSTAYATQVDTRTVTTAGGLRYVTKKVVRYVPVVKKRTVLVNGKTTTVTATQLVPTVRTETSVQTVTNQSTVVVDKPVTSVETHTVTLPPQTVTNTVTQTQTATVTQTVTQTVVTTVQLPGDTTTITITLPLVG